MVATVLDTSATPTFRPAPVRTAASPADGATVDAPPRGDDPTPVSWTTAVVVAVALFLAVVVGARTGADSPEIPDTASVAMVVQPGDTLWDLVRSVVPEGDIRPIVARMIVDREGRPLDPGEVVHVPMAGPVPSPSG